MAAKRTAAPPAQQDHESACAGADPLYRQRVVEAQQVEVDAVVPVHRLLKRRLRLVVLAPARVVGRGAAAVMLGLSPKGREAGQVLAQLQIGLIVQYSLLEIVFFLILF